MRLSPHDIVVMLLHLSRHLISETEKYYPELLQVVKDTPEYNNAAWLLKYQIESMLDIYKRLM